MKEYVIDFETRSAVDIKLCGAYKYSEHSTTSVTMLAVLDCNNPNNVRIWIPKEFRHLCKTEIEDTELAGIVNSDAIFIAHNMPFERAIWKNIMVFRYGFPDLKVENTRDTAVQCSMVGLPRNLETASAVWGGAEIKDMEGAKVMKRFIAPRMPTLALRKEIHPENPDIVKEEYQEVIERLRNGEEINSYDTRLLVWYEDKEDYKRMVEYCRQDVRAEYVLYKELPPMTQGEIENWVLDQQINDRGVLLDLYRAKGIIATIEANEKELFAEVAKITGGQVSSMKAVAQIKAWLATKGLHVDSIDKQAVNDLLSIPNLNDDVRRVLEIRKTLGKSSTAKYQTMFRVASNKDNRARGLFAFYGAFTGRAAGRLLQVQNLPRPAGRSNLVNPLETDTGDVDDNMLNIMASGDNHLASIWYKDLNVAAADCIRAMLIAPQGREFICSDFSAVEARALAWLSNEEEDLKGFRENKDMYKVAASQIYSIPYEQISKEARQVGKTAVLACLGLDTPVVTDNGVKPLGKVSCYDKIYDGTEFVSCDGFIPKGKQKTISLFGIQVTSDHLIEAEENVWMQAQILKAIVDKYGVKNMERLKTLLYAPIKDLDFPTKEEEVGDILNCGPRNKYAVLNNNGEVMIVHNCGYSGGYNALCRFGFDRFPLADGDVDLALSVMRDVMREEDIDCFFITKPTKDVHELLNDSRYKEDTENFLKQIKGTWIVKQWRKNHPNVTKLWYDAVNASIEAVRYPNTTIALRRDKGIAFKQVGRFLLMRLPSGRNLYYLDPKIESYQTNWGTTKECITAITVNSVTKKVVRQSLTISILVENLVQAMCRDLLFNAMKNVDKAGYKVVSHIHDEVVAECPKGKGNVEEYERLMGTVPSWAKGMPLKASGGYIAGFYHK